MLVAAMSQCPGLRTLTYGARARRDVLKSTNLKFEVKRLCSYGSVDNNNIKSLSAVGIAEFSLGGISKFLSGISGELLNHELLSFGRAQMAIRPIEPGPTNRNGCENDGDHYLIKQIDAELSKNKQPERIKQGADAA